MGLVNTVRHGKKALGRDKICQRLTLVLQVGFVDVLRGLGLHEIEFTGEVDEVSGQVSVVDAVLKVLILCLDKDLLSSKHKGELLLQETKALRSENKEKKC